MATSTPAHPASFDSDAPYLDAEFQFLKARAARLSAERAAADAKGSEEDDLTPPAKRMGRTWMREAKCRALERLEEEKNVRAHLDACLAVHRADKSRPKLSLDKLSDEHGLSNDERFVMVAAAVPGISQRICEDILGSLTSFYGALSVGDILFLLDPKDVPEALRFRKLFRTGATLRKAGLIVLEQRTGAPGPDSLPSQAVRLSMTTFAAVTGDDGALTEGEATATEIP